MFTNQDPREKIMRIIKQKTLEKYWNIERYKKAEPALKAWHKETEAAEWSSPVDVKAQYKSASIINSERVVFNICGNKYRLIVAIRYDLKIVFIKYFGTHGEYDEVDAATVEEHDPKP